MAYAVIVRHPIFGKIVVDVCDTYEDAMYSIEYINQKATIEEIEDVEGEI